MIAVREAIYKQVANTYFYDAWPAPAQEEPSRQKPFSKADCLVNVFCDFCVYLSNM